jgi:RES domain-containing protein
LLPYQGQAFRHIPAGSPYDALDFRFAALAIGNRWNSPGEPTLYLASDGAVALAEFARHIKLSRPPGIASFIITRALFRLDIVLERVLDLRADDCLSALSLDGAPHCFLDVRVAQATANFIRATTDAQAILAPSMALLDQPDRWVLVVFLEKLAPEPKRYLANLTQAGAFEVSL